MRAYPLPSTFHIANRKRFAKTIGDDGIAIIDTADVLTRAGDFEYPFRPDSNFYYLTGISEPEAVLVLIPGHANPDFREILFTSGTSDLVSLWEGERLTPEAASKLSGIASIYPLADLEPILDRMLEKYQTVYLNADESLESVMSSPAKRRVQNLRRKAPLHQLRSALPELGRMRTIKDPVEITQIRRAIEVTHAGLKATFGSVKPEIHEYELEAELAAEFIRRGSGHAFMPIVAAGKNTTTIHYMKNDALIRVSDLVLFDVGAEVGWYAADISRTIPATGRFTDRQRAVYEAVLRTQAAAIKLHKHGASVLSIDDAMREMLESEIKTLGLKQPLRTYYAHISHHLGLDVHDTGDLRTPFQPGMVVTCEPGLYLPEEGIGVRIEDDILITDAGCEVLSAAIPSEPDAIEKLVQKGVA